MAQRRVVYTCLFGGYETLLDQPVAAETDIDFIAFTDDAALRSESWRVQLVDAAFPVDQNRSSRRPKILPHEYLPEFDESLYIDNTVLLTAPPEQVFDALLPVDTSMALFAHSFRGPVREEFEAVVRGRRDIDIICAEQFEHYERLAPEVLESQTLWGGFMLRRHHDPALRAAMQTWWEHVLRYSRRDQLSLPYALSRSGLSPRVHDIDNRVSEYHVWPREGASRDPKGGANPDIAAGLRAAAASAHTEAAEQRARADRAEGEATQLRRDVSQAQHELSEARQLLDASRRNVAKLKNSTSWRITRPMRALSSMGRRVSAARRSDEQGRR